MLKLIRYTFISIVVVLFSIPLYSQDNGTYGSYSPYSIYGIGEMSMEGTAYNKSMGGVGIASRNKRFINYLNPAAVTARDTLSFMADFGINQKNNVYSQEGFKSAHNTFNIYNLVMSFPIYKSSAFMLGVTPFSDVGYNFSSHIDSDIIAEINNVNYNSYGTGSVYKMFFATGVTFWKRLSLGAEIDFFFGNLDKASNTNFESSQYRSINTAKELNVRGVTGKFGLQYEQKLKSNVSMVVGGTYRLKSKMLGRASDYSYAIQSSIIDSVKVVEFDLKKFGLNFGDELGVGVSFKGGDKWSAEINYLRSDWSKSGFDATEVPGFASIGDISFSSSVSHSVRAGFEWVPNRNDIRYYFKTCAYRGGFYYERANYKLNGRNVDGFGLTLGMTLPVFRWYNGVSIGIDMGQKGTVKHNLIRERYVKFVVGFNIHDIWFQKPRYN